MSETENAYCPTMGILDWPLTAASVEEERQEIQQCKKIMKDLLGVVPRGYRAPGFEVLPGGLDVVAEEGFAYSTNFMDCDHPYVHRLN